MCECNLLWSLVVVIILEVNILLTLYSVTPCSIINTERTAVQHSVCVCGIFSLNLPSSTYRCRCSGLTFVPHNFSLFSFMLIFLLLDFCFSCIQSQLHWVSRTLKYLHVAFV